MRSQRFFDDSYSSFAAVGNPATNAESPGPAGKVGTSGMTGLMGSLKVS